MIHVLHKEMGAHPFDFHIDRVLLLLQYGTTLPETVRHLGKAGVRPQEAYLIHKAAVYLSRQEAK